MENKKLRKLLVPVFDHLYNLYDHELESYIQYWENVQKKENSDKKDCAEKLSALYEEKRRRDGERSMNENCESTTHDSFKPCPFCGNVPDISSKGTFFDVDCCVSMSFQKSDIVDELLGKRIKLDPNTLKYEDDIENMIFEYVKSKWNTRYNF